MTDEYLIERNFKKFKPGPYLSEGVEACFQKRYDDERGKKYFITINKWEPFTHPHTGKTFPPDYEYTAQLYKKDTHDAVDILFHSSWNLEDVEEYLEMMFDTGKFDYYEEF